MDRLVCALVLAFLSAACGPPGPDPKLPKTPDSGSRSAYRAPLVVDWSAGDRTDLETQMKSDIAVLKIDDKDQVQLMTGCRIRGGYDFVGVSKKEEIVQLKSADELKANLPKVAKAFGLGGKGKWKKGSSVDLALVIVGKRTALRMSARPQDLRGDCEGATHFVRSAQVGAFAMKKGMQKEISGAIEIFEASASGSFASQAKFSSRDGSIGACEGASPDGSKPPVSCAALLRLEIRPLGGSEVGATGATEAADEIPECPNGLSWSGLKCARLAVDPNACSGENVGECVKQCKGGSAQSCDRVGTMYRRGQGVSRSDEKSAEFFQRGCELGLQLSCNNYAANLFHGRGVPRQPERAAEIFRTACEAGEASGCLSLGTAYLLGHGVERDIEGGVALVERSCKVGGAIGCVKWNQHKYFGFGVEADPKGAVKGFADACDGGHAAGCVLLGFAYQTGRGVQENLKRAAQLSRRACKLGDPAGCSNLGIAYGNGWGVGRDYKRAKKLFERGCRMWDGGTACAQLSWMYELGVGMQAPDPARAVEIVRSSCDKGDSFACGHLGLLYVSGRAQLPPDASKGVELYERACLTGHGQFCRFLASNYSLGIGRAVDHDKAISYADFACQWEDGVACALEAEARLQRKAPGDMKSAARLYDKACRLELGEACAKRVDAFKDSAGLALGDERASEILRRGCGFQDGGFACYLLGERLKSSGANGRARALQLFRDGCDRNDAPSCHRAAVESLEQGAIGRAGSLFAKACGMRLGISCESLADLFADGRGEISRDPGRAVGAYLQACNLGVSGACAKAVAHVDRNGLYSLASDVVKTATWACEGSRQALVCAELSSMLSSGRAVSRDSARAADFGHLACSIALADERAFEPATLDYIFDAGCAAGASSCCSLDEGAAGSSLYGSAADPLGDGMSDVPRDDEVSAEWRGGAAAPEPPAPW